MDVPSGLRVEHLESPSGLLTPEPRFSWRLPAGSTEQLGYRLRADNGWDSGWVAAGGHRLLPYAGPPLRSGEQVRWTVQVRTPQGMSAESAPAEFGTGLLWPGDWRADWVEPVPMPSGPAGDRAAALLRGEFRTTRPVVQARLHATAHGIYEAFLNGERVGDAELTPGFTQYAARVQVQTYDVTPSIRLGDNAIGVILADGWFRGQIGVTRAAEQWGDRTAFLAQLHLTHADGEVEVVGTGPTWRSRTGHVLAADLVAGERVDLRRRPEGFDRPAAEGFDDCGWAPVAVAPHGYAGLVGSPAPPVRRVQELVPVSIVRLSSGVQIVDLGQNINGWVRLRTLGPAGTRITLTHAEVLGADGDVDVENLRPALPFLPAPLPAGQVDVVVSAGRPGEEFEPRRTTHGFRYVRVEGCRSPLGPDDVRGVVVHTDLTRTGWFSCDDDRVNRLHEAAVWSFRDNACDIPTDCPHRERAGWVGDFQLFAPTAAFLYDVAGFATKWLRDVAADQWPDGTVANISPCPRSEGRDSPIAFLNGSAGWGDACVLVPWEIYRASGDTRLVAEMLPTMTAWLERAVRIARDQRHPDRAARRPVAAAHEEFLWDAGFHWGEWLEPDDDSAEDLAGFAGRDRGAVATAYLARSSAVLSRICAILGDGPGVARWARVSAGARAAWQAEYVTAEGDLRCDTQADHVRALAFDLVPAAARPRVADRLVELIRTAGGHLGTGFLATPLLLGVLADHGHLDVAYELLLADSEPSWLTMLDRGATTMWERWDGIGSDGRVSDSLNHYSKGAVVSFLHDRVAGIELLDEGPAYRHFRIRPRPGGGLTRAHGVHDSPYGRIESAWHLEGAEFCLRVVVPAGTSAEVVLPDGRVENVGPGESSFRTGAGGLRPGGPGSPRGRSVPIAAG